MPVGIGEAHVQKAGAGQVNARDVGAALRRNRCEQLPRRTPVCAFDGHRSRFAGRELTVECQERPELG
jgi:hypothetical protein